MYASKPRPARRRPSTRRLSRAGVAALLALACAPVAAAEADNLTESFDSWPAAGWTIQNLSVPVGTNPTWFHGTPPSAGGPFAAYNGEPNAYAAANFNSTAGATGTISNWFITPRINNLTQGDTISFYTRKYDVGQDYPDRLEVRLSTSATSCSPGTGETTVGDFTTMLVNINPGQVVGGYPRTWTRYEATVPPMPPGSGCFAFRYFVTNAGPTSSNSDYIGIDQVEIRDQADDVLPETAIQSGPSGATSESDASFTYSATPSAGVGTYECRLVTGDGEPPAFAACPAEGSEYSDLADGTYDFQVRGVSHGGNVDSTPATRMFTVDTTPPATEIVAGPSDTVAADDVSFTFAAEPADDVDVMECRLRTADDDDPPFAPCASSTGQAYEELADGTYTFEVRARDALDNVEQAAVTRTFTVDTTPPSVTLGAGPDPETAATSVGFAYAVTPVEDGQAIECRLIVPADADPPFADCPVDGMTYADLAVGEYRFELRARDAVGNVSETATRTFRVVAPPTAGDGAAPGGGTPPGGDGTKPPAPRPIPFVRPTPTPVSMPPSAFPEVRGLRLERTVFRAATSGPALGPAGASTLPDGRGAWLSFQLDRAARLELRISRSTRRRWRPLRGAVTRAVGPGAVRVPFRGRFRGVTLRPGRYRLSVTVVDPSSGAKTTTLRQFRIRR